MVLWDLQEEVLVLQGLRVLSLGGLPVDDPLPALLTEYNNKLNLKETINPKVNHLAKNNLCQIILTLVNLQQFWKQAFFSFYLKHPL